ncbi:MAG: aminoglycoside phosphotransferase family protein [Propionibacteriaceae bacterium]|nr:aminoglycoside phosphotransferase family protein [Propionibacteriaceae bacterium]
MNADAELIDWVRKTAAAQDPRVGPNTAVHPLHIPGVATRPKRPESSQVFVCGSTVVKIHEKGTRRAELAARLSAIESVELERVWLLPLEPRLLLAPGERLGTMWPRATLVSTVENPPWADAGALLAKLHSADPKRLPKLPVHGGMARFERAVKAAKAVSSEPWLAKLGKELYSALRKPRANRPVHGSFHLGQLGHPLLNRAWRLLDPDDLGTGDPVWDFARPSALHKVGRLDDAHWESFVGAYRQARGPAIPSEGNVDAALETVTRASIFDTAVYALLTVGAHSKETTDRYLDALRVYQ